MQVLRINFEEFSKKLFSTDLPKHFFSGDAKQISPRLLLFQWRKKLGSAWSLDLARYHIIHIPTGLVIADVEYSEVANVKKSFESSKWTLIGNNTLSIVDENFSFTMTCNIRYEIDPKDPLDS